MPFMKLKARQIDLRAPCLEKGESEREREGDVVTAWVRRRVCGRDGAGAGHDNFTISRRHLCEVECQEKTHEGT